MRFLRRARHLLPAAASGLWLLILGSSAAAGEADIVLPDLPQVTFKILGIGVNGVTLMYVGLLVCLLGLAFAIVQYRQTTRLPAHKSMLDVSGVIWETCKSYLTQQGK
ncbi:MAG: sodium-translocating pyrophosphatase, partial [Planctomycetes bacterium]|nr:sodium-translocating pyrophosphatase [Planctomycetota bacterium]